jgi:hypothetical protein
MRAQHIVGLLILGIVFYVTAVAQFADPSLPDKPVEEVQAMKQRAPEDWVVTCLADWDAQTHMTRTQWRTACERVSRDRGYFRLSTASVTTDRLAAPPSRSLDRSE